MMFGLLKIIVFYIHLVQMDIYMKLILKQKNVKELFLKLLHIHKDMYLVVLKIKILLLMKKQIKQKQKYRNIITSSHVAMI